MGGDCLNTGCVPSKALIRSAKFVADAKRSADFGIRNTHVEFDFGDIMDRVQQVIRAIEPHDSAERYSGLGVECIAGEARITSPHSVEVGGRTLTARHIVIAAGATPFVPPIDGLQEGGYLTSDNLWGLRKLPERMLVLGGGPVGCELAQAFSRLGSRVTVVEMLPRILSKEDPDIAEQVSRRFAADGIDVRAGHRAVRVQPGDCGGTLVAQYQESEVTFDYDRLLVAVGRRARVKGYGLEELGIPVTDQGTIEVNPYLQTRYASIFACGDVTGPLQFTHAGAHQAWHAVVNSLFGGLKKFKVDYSAVPWATFTEPEVATVGINEETARSRGLAYDVTRFELAHLDRAIADSAATGFVKVLTAPGSDRLLGASVVGERAGDLIHEFTLALRHGLGLNKILGTVHVYPTWSEANKFAAGAWRRANAPLSVLRWLERYHRWRRGGGAH